MVKSLSRLMLIAGVEAPILQEMFGLGRHKLPIKELMEVAISQACRFVRVIIGLMLHLLVVMRQLQLGQYLLESLTLLARIH